MAEATGPLRAEDAAGAGRQGGPRPLDHGRAELRRRLGLDHRRHPAEHRGHRPGGHPRPAQGPPAQPRARLRERRRVHEATGTRPTRAGSAPRSSWSSRARSPTRRSRTRATGRRSAPTRRPASRSPPASGSTAWRPRPWPWSRPAPAPPTAASTRWPATRPAPWAWPTTSAGTGGRRPACRSSTCPGCPVQPDNMTETLLYLLYQAAGLAPMIPLDEELRPTWLFGKTVHEGCDRGRLLRAGRLRPRVRLAQVPGARSAAGGRWSTATSPSAAGWPASAAARTSAASASAAPCPASPTSSCRSWTSRPAASSSSALIGMYGRIIRRLRSHHQRPRSTRSRSGGTAAAELTTGYHPTTYGTRSGEGATPMATVTQPETRGPRPRPGSWSRCPGTRSPGSWAAWASTPRSTSPTGRSPSATAPRRSSAATASS